MTFCPLIRRMRLYIKFLFVRLRFRYPFFSPVPHGYKPWESLWGCSATSSLVDFHHRQTACPSYKKLHVNRSVHMEHLCIGRCLCVACGNLYLAEELSDDRTCFRIILEHFIVVIVRSRNIGIDTGKVAFCQFIHDFFIR